MTFDVWLWIIAEFLFEQLVDLFLFIKRLRPDSSGLWCAAGRDYIIYSG